MLKKRLPRSLRKYIRQEKARIRREVLDTAKQKELIDQLYSRFLPKINSTKTKDELKIQKGPYGEQAAKIKITPSSRTKFATGQANKNSKL